MRSPLRPRYVLLAALAVASAVAVAWRARRVTFVEVAPVVYRRCSPCHRPGESAPFSLLTYDDVAPRRRQILRVINSGYMPPWKPVAGYAHYRNDRSLTAGERGLLRRWIDAGAPRGWAARVPPPPGWPRGWQLGRPDLVLPLPEAFEVPADGPDVYRNFVFPTPGTGLHYVAAWEMRAGSRTIHHAILNVDRRGTARRLDARDPGPGFAGMDAGQAQSPDGFYLVWTPGQVPTPPMPGASWRLDERTDLVLQLHLHPTGRAETVRPTIGLYFAPSPPTQPRLTLRLGDGPVDIPAGVARWTMTDRATLPVDAVVFGIFPHAHYLGRQMRSWATLPDGRVEWLLRIDDWDPSWQDAYTFAQPLALPRGTVMSMEFVYDNSEGNERNPSSPPRRVVTGEQSTDEMGNITFELMPRERRDLDALLELKYRRLLGSGALAEYNLANLLVRRGAVEEGVAHYRRATALQPDLDAAWFNLGVALQGRGDLAGAAEAYRAALRARPDVAAPRTNLAAILTEQGRPDEALRELRAAVAADPRSAPARNSLGAALARAGDPRGAVAEFRAAQAVEPGNAASFLQMGHALRAMGALAEAREAYAHALALAPGFTEARAALAALDATPDAGAR
jgi:Flp pilus assembly protein TadD